MELDNEQRLREAAQMARDVLACLERKDEVAIERVYVAVSVLDAALALQAPAPAAYQPSKHIDWSHLMALVPAAQDERPLQKALAELIACKDLADQFDALKQDVPDFATAAVLNGIQAEYLRRKHLAWSAVCAALALEPVDAQDERLTPDAESRAMFVARLENMQQNGDRWLSTEAVLALLNDCDYCALRSYDAAIQGTGESHE